MKEQNNTPNSGERFVQAQYIRKDGTIEVYQNYMVSDRGRVGSLVNRWGKRSAMRIRKPTACSRLGHLGVTLSVNNKTHRRSIHRIMLSSFHPELWSMDKNEVDHIDRNPANNLLNNLHWVTSSDNIANRITPKKIRVTYMNDRHTEEFDNMYECSRAFGMNDHWCAHIIRRHNGFNAKHNILIQKI